MMVAIRQYFDHHHPEVQLAVNSSFGSYCDRAKYNLWFRPRIRRSWRTRLALKMMRPGFRQLSGIVRGDEISAVVDAAGFAFGDQHGAERAVEFAEDLADARRAGKRIVMLPQALGPFEEPKIRDAFARIVDACDHLYARDRISLEHARNAAGNDQRIRLAPDFTNLVDCPPADLANRGRRVCIVPNRRMIEHAGGREAADRYLRMLHHCIAAARHAGLKPSVLIHGTQDVTLAEALMKESSQPLEIIREPDPVRIQQLIGCSFLVIASRFHALVSALSQGVPAIGTSWSHKYEMLFGDYDCGQFLLPAAVGKDQIFEQVDLATGPHRAVLVDRRRSNGQHLRGQARQMWKEVEQTLFEN
jgi:colanic acid/amylovoran biosynthesis protein